MCQNWCLFHKLILDIKYQCDESRNRTNWAVARSADLLRQSASFTYHESQPISVRGKSIKSEQKKKQWSFGTGNYNTTTLCLVPIDEPTDRQTDWWGVSWDSLRVRAPKSLSSTPFRRVDWAWLVHPRDHHLHKRREKKPHINTEILIFYGVT